MSNRKMLFKEVGKAIIEAHELVKEGKFDEAKKKYEGTEYKASPEECAGQWYSERMVRISAIDVDGYVYLDEYYCPREPVKFVQFTLKNCVVESKEEGSMSEKIHSKSVVGEDSDA